MGIMPFISHTDGSEPLLSLTISSFTIVVNLKKATKIEKLEANNINFLMQDFSVMLFSSA